MGHLPELDDAGRVDSTGLASRFDPERVRRPNPQVVGCRAGRAGAQTEGYVAR